MPVLLQKKFLRIKTEQARYMEPKRIQLLKEPLRQKYCRIT